ncbi:hypothetical protein RFI_28249 [Reticulomyxa filosa]|uniref:Uncharacterized protein n=1 Tax=Reticulomyxa filosa TaxID=46433 RepID=X6M6P6_RETFI|nr:hypothetical protein RFI_28249 [Reticulomyxa filosa]|eukprot:ETO09137.1 hypothetical protein RFI_28249 [Reticulomyxa filosa]
MEYFSRKQTNNKTSPIKIYGYLDDVIFIINKEIPFKTFINETLKDLYDPLWQVKVAISNKTKFLDIILETSYKNLSLEINFPEIAKEVQEAPKNFPKKFQEINTSMIISYEIVIKENAPMTIIYSPHTKPELNNKQRYAHPASYGKKSWYKQNCYNSALRMYRLSRNKEVFDKAIHETRLQLINCGFNLFNTTKFTYKFFLTQKPKLKKEYKNYSECLRIYIPFDTNTDRTFIKNTIKKYNPLTQTQISYRKNTNVSQIIKNILNQINKKSKDKNKAKLDFIISIIHQDNINWES